MDAMPHKSDYFAFTSRANISVHAVCFTITSLTAVSQVGLPSIVILTAMSDSQSWNPSLLEVVISSKNEGFHSCDLSDLALQIIFDVWWSSMNVDWKPPIGWNNTRYPSSWLFHLHCGIEGTSSPGMIFIPCHQVLRHPSEPGTRSLGKHMLAKPHIAKLNELSESDSLTELTC